MNGSRELAPQKAPSITGTYRYIYAEIKQDILAKHAWYISVYIQPDCISCLLQETNPTGLGTSDFCVTQVAYPGQLVGPSYHRYARRRWAVEAPVALQEIKETMRRIAQ